MAAVIAVRTVGSGVGEQARYELVLSSAAGGFSDQEVAENAAIAANPDTAPITLVDSIRIDGSGTGVVDSDLTSGGVHDDGTTPTLKEGSKIFYTQTKKTTGEIVGRNILAFDKQQGFAAYNAGTTYAIGATVDNGLNSFISLQNANTGHTPLSSPTWWKLHNRRASGRAVAEGITQAGGGSIGANNRWLEARSITIDVS